MAFEPGVELNEFFFFWGGCFVFVFLSSIKGNKDLFIDQHVLRAFYQQYFGQSKNQKEAICLAKHPGHLHPNTLKISDEL